MTTLFGARIALHGATPLYDRKNLERVLDVLEARGLAPQKAGLDERQRKPYERAATMARLAAPPRPLRQTHMYLWRTTALKYGASLALWDAAYLGFDFKPTPPASEWPRVFELADALADCFHPDWGAAGIRFDLRDDVKRAPAQGDEVDATFVHSATTLFPVDYLSAGPLGLASRTYIGSFFADQLGRDRIESLPLVVEKLAWGGYRIDLVATHPIYLRYSMPGVAAWRTCARPVCSECQCTTVVSWRAGSAVQTFAEGVTDDSRAEGDTRW
jgi:hypothetical protein